MKPISQPKVMGFLMEASQLYQERCPELSRYLKHEAEAAKKCDEGHATHGPKDGGGPAPERSSAAAASECRHCGQLFLRADSHRVRLRPRRRPGRRVQSVLRRDASGKRLSLAQRELLRRHRGSASVLMATCHTCNKTTRSSGVNRDLLGAFAKTRGTPGGNGKRKSPQAAYRGSPGTPKTPGKTPSRTPSKTPNKTPNKTPRSVSSSTPGSSCSSSSSSKTPSGVKKWVVQHLSKMLNHDQKPSSKKGTLKDFLSSL